MEIDKFISNFQNHPILFVGTGLSLRYLSNSYSWEDLLKEISSIIFNDINRFYDLKNKVYNNKRKEYDFPNLASLLGKELDEHAKKNPDIDIIKSVNEKFYEDMEKGIQSDRLKIIISLLVDDRVYKKEQKEELGALKKAKKNIGSVITTNYDTMVENILGFEKLIGNNILLSNPYGSVYKIHGCVTEPEEIIINSEDYDEFNEKYDLIRAQLLSLFIHNPIIFIGYSINDKNIQSILETIFRYIDPDSSIAEKIMNNFLIVEYDKNNRNSLVTDYDITIRDVLIRLNKIKTDNFSLIYDSIAALKLPISIMDVRKVRNITGDIYRGGPAENSIQVKITEDIDNLKNSDKVLAIGTEKTINYVHTSPSDIIKRYFSIVEESNYQMLGIIDELIINPQQYFPIFAFSEINDTIQRIDQLKEQQLRKIQAQKKIIFNESRYHKVFNTINEILLSDEPKSNIHYIIIFNLCENNIKLDDLKRYLTESDIDREDTDYRRLVCFYDYKSSTL